jgi:putative phage-type endonuclease
MDAVRAILEVPVVQQRSAEWYEKRKTRITASEVAAILGENPYEGARDVMLRKRGLGRPFTGNAATRYGQAHEPAAIAAYCAALGRVSFEVGLIDHEAIHGRGELSFLAGSPDGITVLRAQKKMRVDETRVDAPRVVRVIGPNGDEPPPLVSDAAFFLRPDPLDSEPLDPVMLEVKCPFRRAIVHGVIPAHYYAQVQINMLICGLPRADFVEYRPPPNFELNIVRVTPDHAWLRAAIPRLRAFHAAMAAPESGPTGTGDSGQTTEPRSDPRSG